MNGLPQPYSDTEHKNFRMSDFRMRVRFILNDNLECSRCTKSFPKKTDLIRHSKLMHKTTTKCELCGKFLKSGARKDVKVQHLLGCRQFQLLSGNAVRQINRLARIHAYDCFAEI